MTMPDWLARTEHLDVTPLVVAIEYQWDGRWWPGRASWFVRDQHSWHVSVIAEHSSSRSGAKGGWLELDEVRPGHHEVRTTHGGWRWGGWEPPFWPEHLAQMADAASNIGERPTG